MRKYLGFRVPAWKKHQNRRMIMTEKFYFLMWAFPIIWPVARLDAEH